MGEPVTYVLLGMIGVINGSGLIVMLRMRTALQSLQNNAKALPVADHVVNRALVQLNDEDWTAIVTGDYDHLRHKFERLVAENKGKPQKTEIDVLEKSKLELIAAHERYVRYEDFKEAKQAWNAVERISERIDAIKSKEYEQQQLPAADEVKALNASESKLTSEE